MLRELLHGLCGCRRGRQELLSGNDIGELPEMSFCNHANTLVSSLDFTPWWERKITRIFYLRNYYAQIYIKNNHSGSSMMNRLQVGKSERKGLGKRLFQYPRQEVRDDPGLKHCDSSGGGRISWILKIISCRSKGNCYWSNRGSGCGETKRDISDNFEVSTDSINQSFMDHRKTERRGSSKSREAIAWLLEY